MLLLQPDVPVALSHPVRRVRPVDRGTVRADALQHIRTFSDQEQRDHDWRHKMFT